MIKKIAFIMLIFFQCIVSAQNDEIQLISRNIKDFGKTKNFEELSQIAEIVREVDILAIQEVVAGYGGARAVAKEYGCPNADRKVNQKARRNIIGN